MLPEVGLYQVKRADVREFTNNTELKKLLLFNDQRLWHSG
jgi:hypothetical protein